MNKGPNATIRLVRRQNHAGTTVSWTTVQREKNSHAYKLSSNVQTACSTDSLNNCPKHSILRFSSFAFASLYALLFLEKEAEIGGRALAARVFYRAVATSDWSKFVFDLHRDNLLTIMLFF